MNIFHKVALQGLMRSRTRTVVTIIGVVLSAALVTAAVTFGLSLLQYAAAGAAQKYGDWHVAFWNADAAFADGRARDDAVSATVRADNVGYAPLDGGANPDKPYLSILGFSQAAFDALPLTLLSGRLPENDREVLIPAHVASNGGVALALYDTLALSVGARTYGAEALTQHDPYTPGEAFTPAENRTYTVVGFYARPAFEERTAPGYTVITRAGTPVDSTGLTLFVTLKNPRRIDAYITEHAEGRAVSRNNEVLRFLGRSDNSDDQLFNALLYSIGGIVLAIIMVGSVFLIYNSFSISLNERTRQIGVLASVGATPRQLRNSVLFEGLCIGAAGIPVGVLAGLLGIFIVISAVAKSFAGIMYSGVPLTLCVSAPAIAASAGISLATILVSAYIPAKKAANTPVMECIRQTNEIRLDARAVKTPRFAARVCGLPGMLALKNCKRNRARYRSIVLSLILSVVLFITTSAFVTDLKQTMAPALSFSTYDVGFGTQAMDDGELLRLYDRLKTAPGVTKSACQAVMGSFCSVPADALSDGYPGSAGASPAGETAELPMEVQFLDEASYRRILEQAGLPAETPGNCAPNLIAVAKLIGADDAGGEKEVGDFRNLFRDSVVKATLIPSVKGAPERALGQAVELTCLDLVPPDIPPTRETTAYAGQNDYYLQVLAPWSLKETLAPAGARIDLRVKGMTFSSENPAQSTAEMRAVIQKSNVTAAYLLLNTADAFAENRNYIFIANVFSYTFIIMISLIAVANVFNTVSTNIRMRRRELAMLRSVGMAERGFNRMMRFECALYGLRALLFGLPLAVASALLVHRVMSAGETAFLFPWVSVGISVGSVLLVIFVTMMYAVGKIKKENIIDALRDDMT